MRLQSIHNEILYGTVAKLEDDLLSIQPIANVEECNDGLQCRELDSLLLIIEHLEK
jgi:hypothetical protein